MDPYNRSLYPHSGAPSARPDPNEYYYQQHAAGYGDVHGQHHRYYDTATTSVTGHHGAVEPWSQSHAGGSPPSLPSTYWMRHGSLQSADPTAGHHHSVEPLPGYPQSPMSPTSGSGLEEGSLSPTPEEVDGQTGSAKSKKYKCPVSGCDSAFARKADKDRHFECVHNRERNKKYQCNEANCNRKGDSGFTRLDHLREHLRNFHHQHIPKRTKAAYRKPGQE